MDEGRQRDAVRRLWVRIRRTKMTAVLVRGIGDIGSTVGHRLHREGFAVMIHDVSSPTWTRREMALTDAIFDGEASLEGIRAVRVDQVSSPVRAAARFNLGF